MPFDIQKALHLEKALAKKSFNFSRYDWAVMKKLDGWYVYIDCIEGRWKQLSSSACREIPSLTDLSNEISKIQQPKESTRFIFEATIPGMEFSEMNGVLNRKYEQAENVILNLHDIVYFDNPSVDFNKRYFDLVHNLYPRFRDSAIGNSFDIISILEVTNDINHFKEIFERESSNGEEGIIGKNIKAGYAFGKRNNDILKLKNEVTLDCRIVKWFWTIGDKGNQAMNLTLVRKNGIEFTVVVNRYSAIDLIISMPESIIGQVAEIRAMEEYPNGMLRQPVFKDFRFNKTEID